MKNERSLIVIKPDGVKRGIVGRILSRFEEAELKIVGMKMVWVDEELAKNHYFLDEEWAKGVYNKAKETYDKKGEEFNYKDHMDYGGSIQSWNMG